MEQNETIKVRRWVLSDLSRKVVRYAFALSLGIFTLYMAGSIPDPGFSDRALFFLLRSLRYASLVSCASSITALGFSVHHLVYRPGLRNALWLLFYFVIALLSASLAMFDSFIIAATEGNV